MNVILKDKNIVCVELIIANFYFFINGIIYRQRHLNQFIDIMIIFFNDIYVQYTDKIYIFKFILHIK